MFINLVSLDILIVLKRNGDFLEHYFTNNPNLKSELRTINYNYLDYSFIFTSDNGVFSKDKADYGSKLLIETLLKNKSKYKSLLDVGCGYGLLGIVLSKILDIPATLCDINKRAIHLTQKNIANNKVNAQVIESNTYESINDKYDLIVTNPPIRAGKDIVYGILSNAKNHLNPDGELWFVIRKDQGAKSAINHISDSYICEIIEKSKGFYIVKAKNR